MSRFPMSRHAAIGALLLATITCNGEATAASVRADTLGGGGWLIVPSVEFTFPCDRLDGCRNPGASQQPDRQVDPFEGTLGRPCAYRWRPTPSGTRKVRVCF